MESSCFTVIDTVPAFLSLWDRIAAAPAREQVRAWEDLYRRRWPELVDKQRASYRSDGVSWRSAAESQVFPRFGPSMAAMRAAHAHLTAAVPPIDARVRAVLDLRCHVTYVLHVGIGCGAGWATRYQDQPAVLFGLENIAEAGWTSKGRIRALVAHELAHLAHSELRRQSGEQDLGELRGPYRRLYAEGFATRMEREVLGNRAARDIDRDKDWHAWCQANRAHLASRFLQTVRGHGSVRPFFGSWYSIEGHIETGYWLGAQVIQILERSLPLSQVATLPAAQIREHCRSALLEMSGGRAPG